MFQAFHTFKGGAGFLGINPIKEPAHILESLLDAARQKALRIDRHAINPILAGGDTLRQLIDEIEQAIYSADNNTPIMIPTLELIARVIGKHRFTYDLWCNSVNMASRVESSGTPGRVHISAQTPELLGNDFALESRGLVQAKGLGEVATFYVNGLQGSTTNP